MYRDLLKYIYQILDEQKSEASTSTVKYIEYQSKKVPLALFNKEKNEFKKH